MAQLVERLMFLLVKRLMIQTLDQEIQQNQQKQEVIVLKRLLKQKNQENIPLKDMIKAVQI